MTYIIIMLSIEVVIFKIDTPLLQYVQSTGQQTTPTGSSTTGQIGFIVIFLAVSIVSVFGLVYLLRKKKIKDGMFWFMAVFFLFSQSVLGLLVIYWISPVVLIAEIICMWLLYMLSVSGKIRNIFALPFMTSYAVFAGVALSLSLPPLTLVILPLAFSMWDLYAVFRGPMVKLAVEVQKMPKLQHLFLVRVGQSVVGMGDLLFYCMMAGLALLFGNIVAFMSIGFMITGVFITFNILRSGKFRALPGLPIPILMGMIGLAIGLYLI